MPLNIIAEHGTLLCIDKPAGIAVWPEGEEQGKTLADTLLEARPQLKELGADRRYGIIHRLDKDTSGVLLVAKTPEAFAYFQEQFRLRLVSKTYQCLLWGSIKDEMVVVHTLLGRSAQDRRKQRTYPLEEPGTGKREAKSIFRVLQRFEGYTLVEVSPETGRKHQIRAHATHLGHPIAGDMLYRFKNQKDPEGLTRQFLHAFSILVHMPDGSEQQFTAELPQDLQSILKQLPSQTVKISRVNYSNYSN
ncbi:MAG: RluA family pseudouridine synthase [bacterium]|nr:RluA family pseudouridine synthase [bacterium]